MESNTSPSNPIPIFSTLTSPFESSSKKSDSTRKPLSLWPGMYHSPMTIALWETKSSIFERLLDPPLDAPPQTELLQKTPSQSRMTILYNFSTDYILREQYRDAWNEVRIGKLLEDLDALAGTISVKHCSDDDSTTRPLYLVTASVDKMVLKKPVRVDANLKIAGAVTWVGRSSIEIQLDVTQPATETADAADSVALTANFIFVARDYKTGKAAPVNRLIPETEREKSLYEAAEARNKLRKRKFRDEKKEIENGEADRFEALLAEGRIFCDMPALADRDSILLKILALRTL
ncbi:Acyl-coenzyme A thioesterase 9, mitochondrial [Sesamum angolense]|uniref:Acyl-coenzyme A thioesterase 9, mitochondrial n=1 Tax=Sesamum angolense TaxID=2727404 RepID=A0AAE1XC02_9LAMI|nr:Acyl-coenzyme A thioesterase 9, mitochondrial [Sesamum angolense]